MNMADNSSAGDAAAAVNQSGDIQAQNGQAVAGDGTNQQPQQPPRQGTWQVLKGVAFRMFVIYMIMSFFRGRSSDKTADTTESQSVNSGKFAENLFAKGTQLDMRIYISEDEFFSDFNNSKSLFWELNHVEYGDWEMGELGDGTFTHTAHIEATEGMMNNGSIYMHVYFTKHGYSPDPSKRGRFARKHTVKATKMINRFKKRKFSRTKNLLTGATDATPEMLKIAENEGSVEILSHWHPNLTVNLVDDHTPWREGSVPQPLDQYVVFHASGGYFPIVYINDYWNLASEYTPINDTTPQLLLTLTYTPISLLKLQFYAAQNMRNQWTMLLGDEAPDDDEEQDTLKRAMLETNPYLLGLTFVVSIVHSVFEFLAFKNDIQFWNNRKSLEGLSVRSVFFGVFQSLVVLLYILDNETNFVVKVSVFIGLLIDCWKITKVTTIQFDRDNMILGIIPKLKFQDKASYTESATKHYDMLAFKYLSWLLFPLLITYGIYSVIYQEHKGWYSWVLNMLYGFLLTFGFIMMTPQLFINYKLKSVAHLPWRMLTYKALNTFIDDIFAFVIKMPTLYRIGCLRDDVIFMIFLYQKYIYPVDYKRVNEFGTTGEMHIGTKDDEQKGDGDASPPAVTDGDATPPAVTDSKTQEEVQTPVEPKSAADKKED
ncbi:putative lipid scramblase CLPTM1 [Amphiura filiformis]|uniref:putative lipid scramblase CLPTM1 n=1 Tax=Amphiura filiformis TaxID=82378 RepID=UPI003B218ABF